MKRSQRVLCFAAACAAALAGCASAPERVPVSVSAAAGEGNGTGGAHGLMLVAHGAGNSADDWPRKLIERVRDSAYSTEGWRLEAVDWERGAIFAPSAARTGYEIGRELGRRYAGSSYSAMHLVGHSMGAQLIQGFVDSYRAAGGEAYIHMTFLDPFSPLGLFRWRFGEHRFGAGADYAESYVVRGEIVVGTNRYLDRAHNFDITGLVPQKYHEKSWTSPHWWTVRYYRESVGFADAAGAGDAGRTGTGGGGAGDGDRPGGRAGDGSLISPGAASVGDTNSEDGRAGDGSFSVGGRRLRPGFALSPLACGVEGRYVWRIRMGDGAELPERGGLTVLK